MTGVPYHHFQQTYVEAKQDCKISVLSSQENPEGEGGKTNKILIL